MLEPSEVVAGTQEQMRCPTPPLLAARCMEPILLLLLSLLVLVLVLVLVSVRRAYLCPNHSPLL